MTLKNASLLAVRLRSSSTRHSCRRHFCTQQPSAGPGPIIVQGVEIAKAYNPANFEPSIRERWETRDKEKTREIPEGQEATNDRIFRMILPPPNVTGKLHLGHALTIAIQDTIARLNFMSGSKVEWIPGFDHAGIATHSMVTKRLERNLETRDLNLEEELHKYASTNKDAISRQLDALGALLDWDKEYYTLDPNHSEAVTEAFIHLFDNGTIQRGDGIVNWSCPLQSTVSDIEVDEIPFNGRTGFNIPGYDNPIDFGLLYHFEYIVPDCDTNIVIATSRPETMFGDTAIAVHPHDTRYQSLIGRSAVSPLTGKSLKIIGDPRVKIEFGSGAVKITPAHDKFDFAIGADHALPSIKTFTQDGKLNEECGEFKGLKRLVARSTIVAAMKETGALVDVKEYVGSVGLCSRTQDIIEPFVIPHWYFRTEFLTNTLLKALGNGQFKVQPGYHQDNFVRLLGSAHDWCLSRQIKWGHRIPAYFHKDYPESWVAAPNAKVAKTLLEDKLKVKVKDSDSEIRQDPDVLDTWFSSALIPLSTSGWPEIDEFQQISLMETGFDIILFWVWRMAIMNLALTEKLPFHNVLLHGVVTDPYGRKMSKSKGNVVDPMDVLLGRTHQEMITDTTNALKDGDLDLNEHDLRISSINKEFPKGLPACGADALRFSLLSHDIYLQTIKLNIAYAENCKHFCNKLWQAMRFYLLHADQNTNHPVEIAKPKKGCIKSLGDKWILASLYQFAKTYEESVSGCRFHLATDSIRNFLYAHYCDVYLELVKHDLRTNLHTEHHMLVMRYAFCTALKLAHPFLPFVTEEIWHQMTQHQKGLLLDTRLPTSKELEEFQNDTVVSAMRKGIHISKEIRSLKAKHFPGSKDQREVLVQVPPDESEVQTIKDTIETLTRTKVTFDVFEVPNKAETIGMAFHMEGVGPCRVSIPKLDSATPLLVKALDEVKLNKMQERLSKLKKQYENPAFQQFAPVETKDRLKKRLDSLQMKIDEASRPQGSEKEG